MSINSITIEQLSIACRHVEEMKAAGVTENLAIRTLELFSDVYAKLLSGGNASPHHINQVLLWSIKALETKEKYPDGKAKDHYRVEHGTPRRAFARKVMYLYKHNNLNEATMAQLVKQFWKLAVITLDEDERLNKIARSKIFETPEDRWKAAGIEF